MYKVTKTFLLAFSKVLNCQGLLFLSILPFYTTLTMISISKAVAGLKGTDCYRQPTQQITQSAALFSVRPDEPFEPYMAWA